jgi:hypothetical protein
MTPYYQMFDFYFIALSLFETINLGSTYALFKSLRATLTALVVIDIQNSGIDNKILIEKIGNDRNTFFFFFWIICHRFACSSTICSAEHFFCFHDPSFPAACLP